MSRSKRPRDQRGELEAAFAAPRPDSVGCPTAGSCRPARSADVSTGINATHDTGFASSIAAVDPCQTRALEVCFPCEGGTSDRSHFLAVLSISLPGRAEQKNVIGASRLSRTVLRW